MGEEVRTSRRLGFGLMGILFAAQGAFRVRGSHPRSRGGLIWRAVMRRNPGPGAEHAHAEMFHRRARPHSCSQEAQRGPERGNAATPQSSAGSPPCRPQRSWRHSCGQVGRGSWRGSLTAAAAICLVGLSSPSAPAAELAHSAPSAGHPERSQKPRQGKGTEALRGQVNAWLQASTKWKGPTEKSVDRFIASMDTAYQAGPDLIFWELCLRAHGLTTRFPGHPQLLRVADAADRLIRQDMRGEKQRGARSGGGRRFSPWALTRVLAANVTAGRGRSKARGGFVPTLEDRRAALGYLEKARIPTLRMALLAIGRRAKDPLRPDVLGALGRWTRTVGPDPAVDLFLVQLLGTQFDRSTYPHPYNVLLDRLRPGSTPLAERARKLLGGRVGAMLLSADWREGARAIRLSTGFPVEERIPMLMDALTVWDQRVKSGKNFDGVTRIQGDLVRALQQISGRSHGKRPGPWIQWWIQVRQGLQPMPGTPEFDAQRRDREAEPRSSASFFGLRPETDRVTFIIDHSGSMKTGFATSSNSRYIEAVDQMMRFLQGAPEGTRFSTILFSDEPVSSGETLDLVTPKILEQARRDLLSREPTGGTNLRPAVYQALALDGRGFPRTEVLEADTIIVLCDGMTSGGKGWVQPMLNKVLPIHPVVFHCVHLGPTSDGVLEALAKGTGGSYLCVGR